MPVFSMCSIHVGQAAVYQKTVARPENIVSPSYTSSPSPPYVMFEELPVVTVDMPSPISKHNYRNRFVEYTDRLNAESMQAFNASFSISGKMVQTILPVTDCGRSSGDHAYIQTFVTMESDEYYYTVRQDFNSYHRPVSRKNRFVL